MSSAQQDVGCIQNGPLTIDVPGTWEAHRTLHADWERKIAAEAALIRDARPAVVLSDISHLGVAAGVRRTSRRSGSVPSWDLVLEPFLDHALSDQVAILRQIRAAYGQADAFPRVAPGLAITGLRNLYDIGPIAEPSSPQRAQLRRSVGADDEDRLILVGFGGIPLTNPPFEQMDAMQSYRFLFDGPVPNDCSRVVSLAALGLPFKQILASVDLVVTKPGYGTIVESVALGIPVVYVRRYNFADEQSLVVIFIDMDVEQNCRGGFSSWSMGARPPSGTGATTCGATTAAVRITGRRTVSGRIRISVTAASLDLCAN